MTVHKGRGIGFDIPTEKYEILEKESKKLDLRPNPYARMILMMHINHECLEKNGKSA